ncbi:hypothetical protein ACU36R_04810 [Pectobacterium brasiliense]|uniref:hypothetical protein n=1 Tax=Pectobacterium brasiliense TaxID=180957 RepID=UPI00406CD670
MARIACLGWGSLIWEPKDLPVQGQWFNEGPLISVEFARQSNNGRITLVLVETECLVHSLWALMKTQDLPSAIEALVVREGISPKNADKHIGRWSTGQPSPKLIPTLSEWAQANNLDHVIWTGLPPKFNKMDIIPTAEQVVEYLKKLSGESRKVAEQYIRLAPQQIATRYRHCIESSLHWYPMDVD